LKKVIENRLKKDMEWLSVDKYGEYKITEAGRKNSLDNLKF
jgi:hypothetical protein